MISDAVIKELTHIYLESYLTAMERTNSNVTVSVQTAYAVACVCAVRLSDNQNTSNIMNTVLSTVFFNQKKGGDADAQNRR